MNINDKRKLVVLGLALLLTISNVLTFTAKAVIVKVPAPIAGKCFSPLIKFETYKKLSPKQLYQLLQLVGFKGHSLKVAWAVAMKETHGNPLAHNYNPNTGDDSYGMFQINLYGPLKGRLSQFHLKHKSDLTNPVKNAQIAYRMSSGGKNWSAWYSNPGERDHKLVQHWIKLCPKYLKV